LCGVLAGPLLTDAAWSAVADGGSVPLEAFARTAQWQVPKYEKAAEHR